MAQDYGYKCAICGKVKHDVNKFTIDHIVPASSGGTLSYSNCQLTCRKCNKRKANATAWKSIPEVGRMDARLGEEIAKILKALPKNKVISYNQLAMLLGDPTLSGRIEILLDGYSTFRIKTPDTKLPIYKVLDNDGYIPRGLPEGIRRSYRTKLFHDGLSPSRDGKLNLEGWGNQNN